MSEGSVIGAATQAPPGPWAPSIVQAIRLVRDPHAFMRDCQQRHGDTFRVHFPGRPPFVVTADPDAVRWLTTSSYDTSSRYGEDARYLLGDASVLFQHDAKHQRLRKLLTPPFHGERMHAYGRDMADIADARIASWTPGRELCMQREVEHITLRVILRCVFGIAGGERMDKLAQLIIDYVDAMTRPWVYGATLVLSGRTVRGLVRRRMGRPGWFAPRASDLLNDIEAILFDEIAHCRRLEPARLAERPDILAMLVASRFDDGSAFSDEELRDHLVTLLLGGYETTATSLAWALYCVLRHPGTVEKMRDEVQSVMGGRFEPGGVKELAYAGAVASESMRLYPIATFVSRQLKVDAPLGGYLLRAGTIVAPCIYLAQRDARSWAEPHEFRPERLIGTRVPAHTFLPFGSRVWRCLGAPFAEYEMRVVLARIVASIDLQLVRGEQIRPVQRGITVAPSEGLPAFVVRRLGATKAVS